MKEGHILVSEPLYGYHYVPKSESKQGYYEINEEEAKVVRMAFTWIDTEGLTLRAVIRRFQELGIKPRKSKHGVWRTSTLSHLLRNKAYIGEARWGSSYGVVPENPLNKEKYRKMKKSSRRMKPEEEWVASKIPVPAIVERELFFRVRKILETNFEIRKKQTKNEYLLNGRIYCTCGSRRSGSGQKEGKHLYYWCIEKIKRFPLPKTCNEKGINAKVADAAVWDKLAEIATSEQWLAEQLAILRKEQESGSQSSHGDLDSITKEIGKLELQQDRFNKAYGAGVFTIEQLKGYTEPARERIRSLKVQAAKIKEAQASVSTVLPGLREIRTFVAQAREVFTDLDFAQRKAIIMDAIDKVVGTKTRLEVFGHLTISSNVQSRSIHRNCRVAECGEVHAV